MIEALIAICVIVTIICVCLICELVNKCKALNCKHWCTTCKWFDLCARTTNSPLYCEYNDCSKCPNRPECKEKVKLVLNILNEEDE